MKPILTKKYQNNLQIENKSSKSCTYLNIKFLSFFQKKSADVSKIPDKGGTYDMFSERCYYKY